MDLMHRYLTDKFDWYEACLAQHDRKHGHVHIKPSLVSLLKHMRRGQDARMHLLAIHMGVTKRRVGQIVAEGVECGVLTLLPDPDDGRASIVRVTEEGLAICDQAIDALHEIEAELIRRIGRENFAVLTRVLQMDWGPPVLPGDSDEPSRATRRAEVQA